MKFLWNCVTPCNDSGTIENIYKKKSTGIACRAFPRLDENGQEVFNCILTQCSAFGISSPQGCIGCQAIRTSSRNRLGVLREPMLRQCIKYTGSGLTVSTGVSQSTRSMTAVSVMPLFSVRTDNYRSKGGESK